MKKKELVELNNSLIRCKSTTKLGAGYHWNPVAGEVGGSLHFGPKTIALVRNHSTNKSAGSWQ